MRSPPHSRRRGQLALAGFSLMELIVVVMIIGIMATIAMPKLLGTSQAAVDNAVRHSLSIVRDAIDRYAADHAGTRPGEDGQETTFKNEIAPYLRGPAFPKCPVGPAENNAVRMMTGSDIAGEIASSSATHSWLYHYGSGEFYVNCSETSSDGVTAYARF